VRLNRNPGPCGTLPQEYLEDSDFPAVFKMARDEYMALPAWKRLQLKKSTPLF
jgi:hypothetical protein